LVNKIETELHGKRRKDFLSALEEGAGKPKWEYFGKKRPSARSLKKRKQFTVLPFIRSATTGRAGRRPVRAGQKELLILKKARGGCEGKKGSIATRGGKREPVGGGEEEGNFLRGGPFLMQQGSWTAMTKVESRNEVPVGATGPIKKNSCKLWGGGALAGGKNSPRSEEKRDLLRGEKKLGAKGNHVSGSQEETPDPEGPKKTIEGVESAGNPRGLLGKRKVLTQGGGKKKKSRIGKPPVPLLKLGGGGLGGGARNCIEEATRMSLL